MTWVIEKTIVLVGMMGSGKSAIGKALSSYLGVPLLDSDHEIEEAANMSIREIFARDGEAFFREKESQVLERLLDGNPCVLSTGGGVFMSGENRQMIHDKGVSVWLDCDLELLWSRVKQKDTRPLLQTPDPKATLTEIYLARVPIYEKADIHVPVKASNGIPQTRDQLLDCLKPRSDVIRKIL